MSDTTFDYEGEDSKKYKVIIGITQDEDLFINIIEFNNQEDIYSSNYYLSSLNEKFLNVIKFKTINDFKSLCEENIRKKTLGIHAPYKSVINSVWKVFPGNKSKQNTFTLTSSKSFDKKLSIYCHCDFSKIKDLVDELRKQVRAEISKTSLKSTDEKVDTIILEKNWLLENIFCLKQNYMNYQDKDNDFMDLLNALPTESGYRKVLIFFDEGYNLNFMLKIMKKFYERQMFVLFFTDKDVDDLRKEINSKFDQLKELFLGYFNANNVFIHENSIIGFKKSILSLVKIYSYFNQLGDGFYKKLKDDGFKIVGLEEEMNNLYLTHYFNILLYGRTGVGKSTFINKMMGEKKSFTLKTKSIGTERNNFYIHKKYPIKIIDVCGFAEGNEAKENLDKLNLIYQKESSNILIDDQMNDIFSFYGDKRNNIHLLIYFNVYNDRYDIFPGELDVIYNIMEKKIPIIFVVNKCPNDFFEDEDLRELLQDEISRTRKNTDFEKYKTYFINCLNGKGFEDLLKGIFDHFKNYLIKEDDLLKIKDLSMPIQDFNNLFEHYYFFGQINPQDLFLNNSLIESVLDIKKLIVELAGYYTGDLGYLDSLSFYFFNRLYNQIWRNSTKNFFPLLTNLVKKIYLNFGFEKTYDECNNFIKNKISQYFSLQVGNTSNISNETKIEEKNETKEYSPKNNDEGDDPAPYNFSIDQFIKDYINLVKLYWYSKDTFRTNDNIQEDKLKEGNVIEQKLFNFQEEDKIVPERLLLLVKRDFGLDNSKRDATSKEKIFQKLFYISYTCNELISELCGKTGKKDIKYTSIYNLYYQVSLNYNNAIKGFLKIINEMQNKEEEEFKLYLGENNEAPPINLKDDDN